MGLRSTVRENISRCHLCHDDVLPVMSWQLTAHSHVCSSSSIQNRYVLQVYRTLQVGPAPDLRHLFHAEACRAPRGTARPSCWCWRLDSYPVEPSITAIKLCHVASLRSIVSPSAASSLARSVWWSITPSSVITNNSSLEEKIANYGKNGFWINAKRSLRHWHKLTESI